VTVELTCPSCGTVSYFDELGRDAHAFCRVCDYPLFWVRANVAAPVTDSDADTGLRRLPGTAGRVATASITCPVCTEPNPLAAAICIRCGADLRPPPPPPPPPPVPVYVPPRPPPPPPPPEPEPRTVWWPWILLGVFFVAGLVTLLVLLV
jgi:hypothetical protein